MPKLQKRVSKSETKSGTYRSESYSVTLIKDYIEKLGWKEGDLLIERLTEDKKAIIVEKA